MINRKLRAGMVGGGIGAFIGPVHRMAATMDGEAVYVTGAFSSDPDKSRKSGEALHLDPSRVYDDYREMAEREAALSEEERIDFVSIVTPNSIHFEAAKTFLQAGFNIVCDKPMTTTLEEARKLAAIVKETGRVFALTHNYTGYPMVKQARHMVRSGTLGKINKVVAEYPQGWLARLLEKGADRESIWRMDPKKAGAGGSLGDIGTHAENLMRYITGLQIEELCADLTSFIPGNTLDDDASLLIRYKGGARGVLHVSQISTGEENGINIRIYGSKLGIRWNQEEPNYLIATHPDFQKTIYSRNNKNLCEEALRAVRLPSGHPEGFIESHANVYREAFRAIRAERAGEPVPACDYPTVDDGVIGMAFIETVVASSKSGTKWTKMIL